MTNYQIKSSRINMGGWVGKRNLSTKLAAARHSIQWQNEYPDRSTDHIHKARNNPLRYDVTDSYQRMWPA
jgi:hypothetical protein